MLEQVVGDRVVAEVLDDEPPVLGAVGEDLGNANAALGQEIAHLEERPARAPVVLLDLVRRGAGDEHRDRASVGRRPRAMRKKRRVEAPPFMGCGVELARVGVEPAERGRPGRTKRARARLRLLPCLELLW